MTESQSSEPCNNPVRPPTLLARESAGKGFSRSCRVLVQASELFYGFNSMNPMLRGVRLVVGFQRCETPELYGHEANTSVVQGVYMKTL